MKFSTNKIYAGIHWASRKQIKDSILGYAVGFCRPVRKVESYPVTISYRFVFGSRPLDTLNTAAMAKMFEDALRAIGVLEDDDPKHVARSILEVAAAPRPAKSKKAADGRPKADPQDSDSLTITIKPYEDRSQTEAL